jgi:hypothetical protein
MTEGARIQRNLSGQPIHCRAGKWANSVPYSQDSLVADLARLQASWRSVQSNRQRDAIFLFLSDVFELVRWWTFDNQAKERAALALALKGIVLPKKIEPYRAVIVASVAPKTIDKRTISKWSRVLRLAAAYKPRKKRLRHFIKERGGINACAARYSARLHRKAQR